MARDSVSVRVSTVPVNDANQVEFVLGAWRVSDHDPRRRRERGFARRDIVTVVVDTHHPGRSEHLGRPCVSSISACGRTVAPRRGSPRSAGALLGRLRVPGRGVGHPDGAALVIDAVPDPAAGRYFELPLLERLAVDHTNTETALQRVLSRVTPARVGRDAVPCEPRVRRRAGADLLPTARGFVGRVAKVPATPRWRWRDPFSSLRHAISCAGPRRAPRRRRSAGAAGGRAAGRRAPPRSRATR